MMSSFIFRGCQRPSNKHWLKALCRVRGCVLTMLSWLPAMSTPSRVITSYCLQEFAGRKATCSTPSLPRLPRKGCLQLLRSQSHATNIQKVNCGTPKHPGTTSLVRKRRRGSPSENACLHPSSDSLMQLRAASTTATKRFCSLGKSVSNSSIRLNNVGVCISMKFVTIMPGILVRKRLLSIGIR